MKLSDATFDMTQVQLVPPPGWPNPTRIVSNDGRECIRFSLEHGSENISFSCPCPISITSITEDTATVRIEEPELISQMTALWKQCIEVEFQSEWFNKNNDHSITKEMFAEILNKPYVELSSESGTETSIVLNIPSTIQMTKDTLYSELVVDIVSIDMFENNQQFNMVVTSAVEETQQEETQQETQDTDVPQEEENTQEETQYDNATLLMMKEWKKTFLEAKEQELVKKALELKKKEEMLKRREDSMRSHLSNTMKQWSTNSPTFQ